MNVSQTHPFPHIISRFNIFFAKFFAVLGGATFRMNVNGSIVTGRVVNNYDEIPTGGRAVSDFEIQHEMPSTPINVNDEYLKIFEKYFEALHIDNSLEIYRNFTIRDVFSGLAASEQRVQINKPSK